MYQVLVGSRFIEVLDSLRRFHNLTVVFDDVFIQMDGSGNLSRARNAFDSYVKECRQKQHRVIITTHRFRRELSTFVQENAALYYVGPCNREDTLRDLLGVSNINASVESIVSDLRNNPPRTAFLVKS